MLTELSISPRLRKALLTSTVEDNYTNPLGKNIRVKTLGEGTEKAAFLVKKEKVVVKRNVFEYAECQWKLSNRTVEQATQELDTKLRSYGVRLAKHTIVGKWMVQEYVPHVLCSSVPMNIIPEGVRRICKPGFRELAGLSNDLDANNIGLTSLDGTGEYVAFDY